MYAIPMKWYANELHVPIGLWNKSFQNLDVPVQETLLN